VAERRILLLITDLELGGTPTVVRELALRLRRAVPSLHLEVACLSKWGPVVAQLHKAGIPVTTLAARGATDLAIVPRLVHLLRDGHFDTVFSFLVHANSVAAAASVAVGDVRWIQSIQTTQPWPRWHWIAQRMAARPADAVVVPSRSVAVCAHEWAHVPAEKIVVIPNAIDLAEFALARSPVPQQDPRPYPVTFLGRLDPVKDLPTLIEAIKRVDAASSNAVHLHIYGQGSDRERVEKAIAQHQLKDRVTLHGATDRPQTALAESGLLVLPSLAEGFGLVLIEAMAAGVPVVATGVAGISDVVRPHETGLLVPPSNPAALASAIRQIVEHRELRQRLIAAADADVRERFTWDRVLPQYRALLHL
jgi:glycosyltransferase involved in cell wall biosynthesis